MIGCSERKRKMVKVAVVNTMNLDSGRDESVEVHAPDCRHLAQYARHPFFEGTWEMEANTPSEVAFEHNADFIAEAREFGEDPNDHAWNVAVLPCTRMTSRVVVVNGVIA